MDVLCFPLIQPHLEDYQEEPERGCDGGPGDTELASSTMVQKAHKNQQGNAELGKKNTSKSSKRADVEVEPCHMEDLKKELY